MNYRLALDLGTSSLGWAIFRLNDNSLPVALIRAGVRIFSDGRNPKDGSSLAVTRRNARAMRRRRDRLLKRKERLIKTCIELGFFPSDTQERRALETLNPYELRARGLDTALTPPEFARALFHINQRRGFQSNRKTDKADKDGSLMKNAIRGLHQKLVEENCRTLGEWLHKRHQLGLSVRARLRGKTAKDKQYDFYADRAMISREFDLLWEKQSALQPAIYTPEKGQILRDILLHQRDLKPVKPGRCTLLPDEVRAPLALPSVQRFRILQELNNLRYLDDGLQQHPMTLAQRDTLATMLEKKASLSFTAILKAAGLPGTVSLNLDDGKRELLTGNKTSVCLAKPEHFGDLWHTFTLAEQDTIVMQLLEEASETALINWLTARYPLSESQAERIATAGLPEGYGNLSQSALMRILPALSADVITYDKAVLQAGFESHSALSHTAQSGEVMPELPYYGLPLRRHVAFEKDNPRNDEERYGKIANPTVHIGLNQVRVVVNELIQEYGLPQQVVIEVARELKLSREKQIEIQREQKKNQDRNDMLIKQACDVLGLEAAHLDKAKRRELSQKMQLWVELNPHDASDRRCPYTGESIGIARLLSAEVEIEHILPYSRTLDDSLTNKTIALARANRAKGNQTPFEAFSEGKQAGFDYEAILLRVKGMPLAKRKRFAPDGMQNWLRDDKDFLARALNDTAYLSRIAKEYLSCICPERHVWAIPGKLTAMIRGKFGLNSLLSGDESKNRHDHRHHALDACVIGITDRATLNAFAHASHRAWAAGTQRLLDQIAPPFPTYREQVSRAMQHIIVSHRPDHGYQGAMHEATAYGILGDGRVHHHATDPDTGRRERHTAKLEVIGFTAPAAHHRHGFDETGKDRAYKGYKGGSNYCMEIYADEKGRWHSEVVTTFQAYQVIREHGEVKGWEQLRNQKFTQHGNPLVMRIMSKDYLRLETSEGNKIFVIAYIAQNGQIFMAEHNEANVDARNRSKDSEFGYTSKKASSLQKSKGVRVTVSPGGRLNIPKFG